MLTNNDIKILIKTGVGTVQAKNKLKINLICFGLLMFGITSLSNATEKVEVFPSKKYFNEYLLMQEFQKSLMLDGLVESIDPNLQIESKECGQVNAFYSPSQKKITLCYEPMNRADSVIDYFYPYPRETIQNRSTLKAGVFMGALLHELGHAIIHLKDIPVLGNQEDAADSIATITLLELTKKSPQQGKVMIVGGLTHDWGTRMDGLTKFLIGKDLYADEHPLNEQRVFNRVCLAYGSNPALFIDTARQFKLPASRAKRCQIEYQDTKRAVDALIINKIQ